MAAVRVLAAEPAMQLALLFLALQLGVAVLVVPFEARAARWLERVAPDVPEEEAGRPRFLHARALEEAGSALALARAEQARLLERLPPLLDPLREEGGAATRPTTGSALLEAEIRGFLAALLAGELAPEPLEEAVRLQARLADLVALRDTLEEFTALAASPGAATLGPQLAAMAEALHLLLEELRDLAGAEAAGWLIELAADRGEMVQRLRRARAAMAREDAFQLTGLFERAVWLVRRLALLEREAAV
jgi:phosphate:Na+ symporter